MNSKGVTIWVQWHMPIAASAWIHRDGLRTSATECALLKIESHHRFGGFRCRDSNHHNSTLWQHAIVRRVADRDNMGSWRDPVGGVPSLPSLPVETPVLKKRQVFPRSASVAPMRMWPARVARKWWKRRLGSELSPGMWSFGSWKLKTPFLVSVWQRTQLTYLSRIDISSISPSVNGASA